MKFKIYRTVEGFRVSRRENFGCGWSYIPLPYRFQTEAEAKKYIELQKAGEADAKKNK